MKHIVTVILLSLLTTFACNTVANDNGTQQLDSFVNNTQHFSANFIQEVVNEDGDVNQASSGSVAFSKPNQFRWDYEKPNVQQIISDGINLWVHEPDLIQATVQPINQVINNSPIGILLGDTLLSSKYDFIARESSNGLEWVELKSKIEDPNAQFEEILIGLSNNKVNAMALHDFFGQITRITFSDVEVNNEPDINYYNFTPPEGTDVIDQAT